MASARQRDPETVRAGLAAWSGAEVGAVVRPSTGGLSSETYLFDAGDRSLVARLAPAGDALFPVYDLRTQGLLIARLGELGVVPVPRVEAYVDDPQWLGAPFLVMERVAGLIPTDNPPFTLTGFVHDAPPERQRVLQGNFVDACARIHRADWRGELGVGHLVTRTGGPALAAEVAWWSDYLDWATDGAPPGLLADARAWCAESMPDAEPEPSLLWGDVRIPNVVFDDAFAVRAVLDWEMASIGPAELDVGWLLVIQRMTTDVTGDLPGFLPRAELLARYETRLGRPLHDLAWYEAWAAFRSAAIMVRLTALLHEMGLVPDLGMQTQNPPADMLRALLA